MTVEKRYLLPPDRAAHPLPGTKPLFHLEQQPRKSAAAHMKQIENRHICGTKLRRQKRIGLIQLNQAHIIAAPPQYDQIIDGNRLGTATSYTAVGFPDD